MSYENTEDLGTLREQLHRATEDCGRLQKLLDESERRYRLMADNVKDVSFVADMEGRITYITPSVQHMLGYTVRECMGRGLDDIMTPESRRIAQQKLSAAVARGWDEQMAATNVMAEYELVHKDGSAVWAEVSTSFIRDSGTQLSGVVGSWRDVSDRRRIHQALSSSEQKYRLLMESLPAGVVIGQDFRIAFANSAAARITGYSVEQLLSLPPEKTRALVHPEDWKLAWRPFGDGLLLGNECGHFEARVVRSDGKVRSVEALVRSIEYRGRPAVEATCLDITERREAEAARREGEEKFTRVYEDSPIGIILYDARGKPVEMNAAAASIFGLADDFAVKAPSIFDDPSMVDEAKAKLRNGEVVRWEGPLDLTRARELGWYGTTRSGTICISIVVSQLGQKEKGVATGYIAQIQDITERKQAEQKLQEACQEERRLRSEVEREMKSRHEFLRALVHELKTPVTAVIASGELLAMELPEGPLLRAAEILNRSAENLNKRIDELLDLARGELGMLRLKVAAVDPLQLLGEVAGEMTAMVSNRGQCLVSDLPSSLQPIWGDKDRLRQVALNLLSNASKFMDAEGSITLRARQNESELLVEVEDTGPGMDEAEQRRLFRAYERLVGDRDRYSGLGLGLALSKTIVELHGGRIWVKSQKGKGSTFGFSLPVRDGDTKNGQQPSSRSKP